MTRTEYKAAWYQSNKERCAARVAVWKAANLDKVKAYKAAWKLANKHKARKYYETNKDNLLAQQREYYAANASIIAKRATVYVERNREKTREYQNAYGVAYRAAHPNLRAALESKRRATLLQRTPLWADLDLIEGLYEVAALLSRSGVRFEVDHQVPLQGKRVSGLHSHDNLSVVPRYINRGKHNHFTPGDLPC